MSSRELSEWVAYFGLLAAEARRAELEKGAADSAAAGQQAARKKRKGN